MAAVGATIRDLVERTPTSRDRVVDFLRAASILAVVFGHWFIAIVWWDGGIIRSTSAVGVTSYIWLGTWLLQVMPIFFFVGGFSNYVAYTSMRDRGGAARACGGSRSTRLLRPSLVFLGVWAIAIVVLHLANVGAPAGPVLWGG